MKKITYILLLYIPCYCFAQTSNEFDSSKVFFKTDYNPLGDIYFEYNSIQPTNDGLKVLNIIGNNKKKEEKFWFIFLITISRDEQQDNINLEFKRILFVLNYLKQNYNIEHSSFLFEYSGVESSKFRMRLYFEQKRE